MAVKFRRGPAATRTLPVTAGTASGTPVVVGAYVGVTLTKEGEGGNASGSATVGLGGVTRQPVSTTSTLAVGAPVYITSSYVLTPVSTSNTLFGYALEAKGSTANQEIDIEIHRV